MVWGKKWLIDYMKEGKYWRCRESYGRRTRNIEKYKRRYIREWGYQRQCLAQTPGKQVLRREFEVFGIMCVRNISDIRGSD